MGKKNAYVAAILNFFLIGLGTLYNGKRAATGILMTIGALIATYVEFNIKGTPFYNYQALAFLLLGIGAAIDGWREAKMS